MDPYVKWFVIAVLILVIAIVAIALWAWTPDIPRTILETKYANQESRFVEANGVRLHIRDTDTKNAPAVLLLHGFGASLHTWDEWVATLKNSYRVVRIDLPGAGLTGPDPTGDYRDERTLAILNQLLESLGISKTSIVGNSVGGRIAWRFAAQFPTRVEKLVLVSPDGFASPGFEYGKAPQVSGVFRLVRYALPKSLLRMNLAPAYANPEALNAERITRYHSLLLLPGQRDAMLDRMAQTILTDPVPQLQKITAPTLLLWGEQDALIPIVNAQDYLRALPTAKLVTLTGVGHVPQEEAPAMSLAPLLAFLANNS